MIKQEDIKSADELLIRIKQEMFKFKKQAEFKDKFPEKWIPTKFQIIEEEFSEANQMINSTLKMVRHRITENYQERLEMMYSTEQKEQSEITNREIIKHLFDLE